jgi:4'-phosphopantetheinyl transferase EntD
MRETWYVLEDGTPADPNEVAPDDKGVLRHKGGRAVAIGPHGPRSTGIEVEEMRAKPKIREIKAEDAPRTYKTRESKAR